MTEETKREKFERIATARLSRVNSTVKLLGNLSGSAYESTPERRAGIIADLRADLEALADQWGCPIGTYVTQRPFGAAHESHDLPGPPKSAITGKTPSVAIVDEHPPCQPLAPGGIDSRDRRDIRAALALLTRDHGPDDPGVASLRKVILGWVPETYGENQ